jgi:putative flippase GtrA
MRWLKFSVVGTMGAALQLALLAFFARLGMHYLLATAISVEAAILHNFVWHRRWTWHDRLCAPDAAGSALARFNLTNGLVSISGNLLSAYLLAGFWRIDPVVASAVSIAIGAFANFFLSDRVVFVSHGETAERLPSGRQMGPPSICKSGKPALVTRIERHVKGFSSPLNHTTRGAKAVYGVQDSLGRMRTEGHCLTLIS